MDSVDADTAGHFVDCTATENGTCKIAEKLSFLNKALIGAMVELREHSDTSGQLGLVDTSRDEPSIDNFYELQLPEHPKLLTWLLKTHRCISSVDLNASLVKKRDAYLLDALHHSPGLKTLKLRSSETLALIAASAVIPCLTGIEELDCTYVGSEHPIPQALVDAASKLLQTSSCLETLRLNNFRFQARDSNAFFAALSRNSVLKELNFRYSSLECDTYPRILTEYLSNTTVLKVLVVDTVDEFVETAIIAGVLKNRSIERLTLGWFTPSEGNTAAVAQIISTNRVMRHFSLSTLFSVHDRRSAYNSWHRPLMENETLEEVSLPLMIFHPRKWAELFRKLPMKKNLKKIHIDPTFFWGQPLQLVCAELKKSGSENKVSLGCCRVIQSPDILHCKSFSSVSLNTIEAITTTALRMLPDCQHLTFVEMGIKVVDAPLNFAMAEFLESTRSLRKLRLSVNWGAHYVGCGENIGWHYVLEALSRNDSLRDLCVTLNRIGVQDTEGLADAVRRSTTIRSVEYVNRPTDNATVFVRRLADSIVQDYILLTVCCRGHVDHDAAKDWFTVEDTARRNSNIVARAARLLKASPSDRYIIGALERISMYPALQAEVADLLQIDKAELVSLIHDRIAQTESLDGFMWVTGVVKEGVSCHRSDDGAMQLDGLNEYCWRHVRGYLFVDDIKGDIGPLEITEV